MTKQQIKSFSTGAIVIVLVLLPGLASFNPTTAFATENDEAGFGPRARCRVSRLHRVLRSEDSRYTRLTFDTLKSWTYIEGKTPIPDFIKKLDGKSIEMIGFMMPLSEVKNITQFLLVPSLWAAATASRRPSIIFVVVKMPPGQTTKFFNDVIRIRGKIQRGRDQTGWLFGQLVCPYGGTNRRTMSIDTKEVFVPIAEAPQAPLRPLGACDAPIHTHAKLDRLGIWLSAFAPCIAWSFDRTDFSSL